MAMRPETRDATIIGGGIGVLVWLFDYRHLVLGGVPDTFLSDGLRGLLAFDSEPLLDSLCSLGHQGVNIICINFSVLFIFTAVGLAAGGLAARLWRLVRHRD
jgi:ABC-type microcin C transport system permease subunit YejB